MEGKTQEELKAIFASLKPVEIMTIEKVMEGFSSRQIALQVHKSERTVENWRAQILEKTGFKNMVHLAVAFMRAGLLK